MLLHVLQSTGPSATTKVYPGPEASIVPGWSSLLESRLQDGLQPTACCHLAAKQVLHQNMKKPPFTFAILSCVQVISWDPDKWLSHIQPVFKL